MGDTGSELPQFPAGNSIDSETAVNKSVNIGTASGDSVTPTPPTDPDLAAIIAAWSDLPPAVRLGIAAMVKAATPPQAAGAVAAQVKFSNRKATHGTD